MPSEPPKGLLMLLGAGGQWVLGEQWVLGTCTGWLGSGREAGSSGKAIQST